MPNKVNRSDISNLRPVFIGGCDRSGTTLLGSLLGGNPEVVTTPESQFVCDLYPETSNKLQTQDLHKIVSQLCRHWRLKIWEIPELEKTLLSSIKVGRKSYSEVISTIIKTYAKVVGKDSPTVWVDHTPSNLLCANRLIHLFPTAKFLHIVRDGRGVAASFVRLPWGPNTVFSAADFWVSKVGVGTCAEMWLTPEKVMRVYYEDLLLDTESVLSEICNFLDLDYTEEMRKGGHFVVPQYTRRQHVLVGKKPDSSKVHSWKRALSPREIEIFEARSGDMLTYLGYELMFKGAARGPNRAELYRLLIKETICKQLNTMRSRLRVMRIRLGL